MFYKTETLALQEIRSRTTEHDADQMPLNKKQYHGLKSADSTSLYAYGLPKIHKPDVPLRPITSYNNPSMYELSKYPVAISSPLQNNINSVQNSRVFADRNTGTNFRTRRSFRVVRCRVTVFLCTHLLDFKTNE